MIHNDTQGLLVYGDLTPSEAADLLAALKPAVEAAADTHTEWGGDYSAHLTAHVKHRQALVAASQRTAEA